MAVAFDELKTFMDSIPESPSQDEWDTLLAEAEAFDEDTSSLAVEHLHLYTPSVDEKAFEKFNENHDEAGRFAIGGSSGSSKPALERTVADFPPANPNADISRDRYHADGKYTPERQELHDAIIHKALEGHHESENPTMYLLGGGTASGKSSLLRSGQFGIPEDAVLIDSDAVKSNLPDYKEMVAAGDKNAAVYVHKESSDVSKELIKATAEKKYNGVVDTTGDSGMEYLEDKVNEMRANGHRVVANYATVNVETAIARSNKRGEETGRIVPEALIRAIHKSVSEIMPKAVERGLFDEVTLWDTNSGAPVKVMSAAKGQAMTIHDQNLWQKFLDKAK